MLQNWLSNCHSTFISPIHTWSLNETLLQVKLQGSYASSNLISVCTTVRKVHWLKGSLPYFVNLISTNCVSNQCLLFVYVLWKCCCKLCIKCKLKALINFTVDLKSIHQFQEMCNLTIFYGDQESSTHCNFKKQNKTQSTSKLRKHLYTTQPNRVTRC